MKKQFILLFLVCIVILPTSGWSFLHSTSAFIPPKGLFGTYLIFIEGEDFGLGLQGRYTFTRSFDGGVILDFTNTGNQTIFYLGGDGKILLLSQKKKKPVDLAIDPFANIILYENDSSAIIGCRGIVNATFRNVGSPQSWLDPIAGVMFALYTGREDTTDNGGTKFGVGANAGLQYGIDNHWAFVLDVGFFTEKPSYLIQVGTNYHF